jgi:hypothetical protein
VSDNNFDNTVLMVLRHYVSAVQRFGPYIFQTWTVALRTISKSVHFAIPEDPLSMTTGSHDTQVAPRQTSAIGVVSRNSPKTAAHQGQVDAVCMRFVLVCSWYTSAELSNAARCTAYGLYEVPPACCRCFELRGIPAHFGTRIVRGSITICSCE